MNNTWKCASHQLQSLCCLETQNALWCSATWSHWQTPRIYSQGDLWRIDFCIRLRPRAVHVMHARFARDEIINSLPLRHSVTCFARINNNYSPKWRWLVVVNYRAAKQWGKYPQLATDTEVNNCFIILKQWDNWAQKWWFLTQILLPTITILARNDRAAAAVAFSCRQLKLLKAFV